MMEPEARIEALKVAVKVAYDLVAEAFEDLARVKPEADGDPFLLIAYGHVLQALIQDIDDGEAAR